MNGQARRRVLLTGGSGFLATNWACAMRDSWDVVLGTHTRDVALRGVSSERLALASEESAERDFARIQPDLVIHTAGLADVDGCDRDPALARAVNGTLAHIVAVAAASQGIPLVHISTDHLFDGTVPNATESLVPRPMNEYARTKLLAEEWVGSAHPAAVVLRTNFFGWGHGSRRSFSDWIIETLRAGRALKLFDDVHFTPILADRFAEDAHAIVERGGRGVFNLCGDERISKYDFGVALAERYGLPVSLIERASIENAGLVAPRPRDMSLDTTRVRTLLGRSAVPVARDIEALRRQEEAGRHAELLEAVAG